MRTGLFGGTFDPIHMGHLFVAETVRNDFNLDRILFIPAAIPPNKVGLTFSPPEVRMRMAALAVEENPHFHVSDLEIRRGGISYTIDTIRWLKASEAWQEDELFLLIGSDSLLDLRTWKDPEALLDEIRILVVKRPDFDVESVDSAFRDRFELVQTPLIAISSTEIRERVRLRKSIRYWVPEAVEAYIHRKGLYR
jgi:nicotinate-nucleotide adenylyltransferase